MRRLPTGGSTVITIRPATGAALLAQTAPLQRIYHESFSGPPWSESADKLAAFPTHLRDQLSHPGAGGCLAFDGADLVGATYGWTAPARLPRGTEFEVAVADAAPPEAIPRMVAPSTVVAELMVTGTHRRRGVARRLLETYLAGKPAAWLVTHRDGDAPAFYRRTGWREESAFRSVGNPLLLFTWSGH
ncbi:GNAT family N-acetyltransferase [Solwaraspora sp. WMMD1047]|uniref:GNAT family N-acetyltransferase n=1 Tax=Solwaraspora sp. WMMD1047 TaxID=3016102 RepID=UPI0024163556|nr:GNAT family N-acetyltransferase [Solwaraspora sp. WMMD1047]MDG4833958.1 GNAT family N-acetyltransferase [Solwaraspora sp. WMMD1047]